MLVDYEYVQDLLNLEREDEKLDRELLYSAYRIMCNYLGYDVELNSYYEVLSVEDYKVILSYFPVTSVDDITDCKVNATVDYFTVDYHNRSILFQPAVNGHCVAVNYKAGYTEDSFPADLREAVIKLFVIRRNDFYNITNNNEGNGLSQEYLPSDVKRIFDFYSKKRF